MFQLFERNFHQTILCFFFENHHSSPTTSLSTCVCNLADQLVNCCFHICTFYHGSYMEMDIDLFFWYVYTKYKGQCKLLVSHMPSRWQKCEYPENLHTLDQERPLPLEKAFIHSVSREEVVFSFKMWNALKFIGWSWIGNDWRIWWAVTIKLPIHCHHSISSWQTSTLPKHKSWNLVWVKTILWDIKKYIIRCKT